MKFAGYVLAIVAACGIFGHFMGEHSRAQIAAHPPSAAEAQDNAQNKADNTAIEGCRRWTETHSPMTMGEVLDEGNLRGKKLPEGHYRVAVKYRAGASGLLMQSTCEYASAGDSVYLVSASIR
jgi:hypothetical protein